MLSGMGDRFSRRFPDEHLLTLDHETDDNGWILGTAQTGNNTHFASQWIQCSYSLSGGYGPTLRYIYYVFVALAVLSRRITWLTTAALGLVMTYSSAAAVHAVLLAAVRKRMPRADELLQNPSWQVAQVAGPWRRQIDDAGLRSGADMWIPLLPMAWDNDADPVLAIVGAAFLVLLPMHIWSSTLRRSRSKALVAIWGCLLLMGLVAACVNAQYVWQWTFPQLRFCPVDAHDPLPMTNAVADPYGTGKHWVRGDPYRWNRVVGDHFVHRNLTAVFPTHCIYPCFGFSWPLRDPDEIKVNPWSYGWKADTDVADTMFNLTVTLVISSCVANLSLVVMGRLPGWKEWKHLGVPALARKVRTDLSRKRPSTLLTLGHGALVCWIVLVYLYALVVSPLSLLFFVGYTEWLMWNADAGAESFKHVGQWGSLIGAVMVLGAGIVSVVTESFWYKRGAVREEVLELGETERPETYAAAKRDPGGA